MKKVYIHRLGEFYNFYMDKENEEFLSSFCEIVTEGSRKAPLSDDELIRRMSGAEVLLSMHGYGSGEITDDILKQIPSLKLICIAHWCEQFAETEQNTGIRVVEVSNGNTIAVAEWTLACALMGVRKIVEFNDKLKRGSQWCEPRRTVGMLAESVVGIVALGRIGRYVARYMRMLGAKVIAHDKYATPEEARKLDIELVDMDEVFARSDVISIHLPVLPSTRGLIKAEHFSRIKDGAVLINSSRAAIYDEAALVKELATGRFNAYIDVFSIEPIPDDHPFRSMDNVTITPHIAGDNLGMFHRCGREAISAIKEYFETGNVVDRKLLLP